ncbi:transposase, partial [Corynebacterium doosanense]
MPKNTYTDEFKADAVRLYEDTKGASFSSIAVDLGISRATLKNWVYAARRARGV